MFKHLSHIRPNHLSGYALVPMWPDNRGRTVHAHKVGTNTYDLVLKLILRSSDWLMHSELGYFASSLVSSLDGGAATLRELAGHFVFKPLRVSRVLSLYKSDN